MNSKKEFCSQTNQKVKFIFSTQLNTSLKTCLNGSCWVVVGGKFANHLWERKINVVSNPNRKTLCLCVIGTFKTQKNQINNGPATQHQFGHKFMIRVQSLHTRRIKHVNKQQKVRNRKIWIFRRAERKKQERKINKSSTLIDKGRKINFIWRTFSHPARIIVSRCCAFGVKFLPVKARSFPGKSTHSWTRDERD